MGRKPQPVLFCRKCKAHQPREDFPLWKMGRLRPGHYCFRHRRPETPEGQAWCPDCAAFKPVTEFGGKSERGSYCRAHARVRGAEGYRRNVKSVRQYRRRPEVRTKQAARERERRKRPDLIEKERSRTISRRAEFRKYARRPEVRAVRNKQSLDRYRKNVIHRLRCRMSHSLRAALRGYKGQRSFGSGGILPYTVETLRTHLERQFLRGMNWENYGSVWHIDHILPVTSFKITGRDCTELQAAFALSNLRPLWAAANISKHARRLHLI